MPLESQQQDAAASSPSSSTAMTTQQTKAAKKKGDEERPSVDQGLSLFLRDRHFFYLLLVLIFIVAI
jgi:hypothetical protein